MFSEKNECQQQNSFKNFIFWSAVQHFPHARYAGTYQPAELLPLNIFQKEWKYLLPAWRGYMKHTLFFQDPSPGFFTQPLRACPHAEGRL